MYCTSASLTQFLHPSSLSGYGKAYLTNPCHWILGHFPYFCWTTLTIKTLFVLLKVHFNTYFYFNFLKTIKWLKILTPVENQVVKRRLKIAPRGCLEGLWPGDLEFSWEWELATSLGKRPLLGSPVQGLSLLCFCTLDGSALSWQLVLSLTPRASVIRPLWLHFIPCDTSLRVPHRGQVSAHFPKMTCSF